MTDIVEGDIYDTFCTDLPRVERISSCHRLTFTVDEQGGPAGEGWKSVVCRLVIPTENLRAIAAAILAAASGQVIAEPAPAGAARH
jgi:hypothetical protein